MINLLAAPKSDQSPPGRDSRQAHHAKNKKPAEFNPSRTGQTSAHACWRGMRCPTSAPLAAAASARSCGSEVEGCADDAELYPPSLPRRVDSSQPARNLKRLNDSASTFGRRSEYVGLCSLSEPLDSCRESPATPGDPKDTRPFKSEEGDGISLRKVFNITSSGQGLSLLNIREKN